jgi:Protein of unknown function, DUF547
MAVALLVQSSATALQKRMDQNLWDEILRANVDEKGFVDYLGIRVNKGGDLYEYLSWVEVADISKHSESEKLAFWINAYNANVIKLLLAKPSLQKVSEDFGLFDQPIKIARMKLSLNDIEHRVIRRDPSKGGPIEGVSLAEVDPRIHFALVCGAIDCPKLLNRAYTGTTLNDQLQAGAVNFANTPKHLRLKEGKLVMSTLLKWYGSDFDKVGGVSLYLQSLLDPKLRTDANDIKTKLKTDYPSSVSYQYDWTLNDIRNKK